MWLGGRGVWLDGSRTDARRRYLGKGTSVPKTVELPAGFGLGVVLLLAYLLLPLVVMFALPGVDRDAFVCRVEVKERLAETLGGQLEFLRVNRLDGRAPAETFVAVLDHGYTAGIEPAPERGPAGSEGEPGLPPTPVGSMFDIEATLMTREVFYGEQYLFFGYPQVYVSQVRDAFLWPSQVSRVQALYVSPFVSLASIYFVWVFPFIEEYSLGAWLLMIARFLLTCVAVAAALVWRKKRGAWVPGIVGVIGAYAILSVVLAIPSL